MRDILLFTVVGIEFIASFILLSAYNPIVAIGLFGTVVLALLLLL